jgi:hypothetical protein
LAGGIPIMQVPNGLHRRSGFFEGATVFCIGCHGDDRNAMCMIPV